MHIITLVNLLGKYFEGNLEIIVYMNGKGIFENMKLSERLNDLMTDANDMTSLELSKLINVSVQTINTWKRGTSLMTLKNLIAVSNALRCSIDFLIGNSDKEIELEPLMCPSFYLRLREVMSEKDITRYRLTHDTNIKDSYLYLWKKGSDVKIPALIELAKYLDVSIDYLVGRDK